MCDYSQIQGKRSKKDRKLWDKPVPYFQQESGPCPLDWRITIHSNVDLVFFQQSWHIWLCWKISRTTFQCMIVLQFQGTKINFLLKFNEARISEWNITVKWQLYVCCIVRQEVKESCPLYLIWYLQPPLYYLITNVFVEQPWLHQDYFPYLTTLQSLLTAYSLNIQDILN